MDKRRILLRIKLCAGIGINNEYKLVEKVEELPGDLEIEQVLTELISYMKVKKIRFDRFEEDFLSARLDKQIEKNSKINFISIFDDDYPSLLRESGCPPIILFYAGDLNILSKPLISVVGSRDCTEYSIKSLKKIMTPEVFESYGIASGLASGVDGLSHQCALANNGKTIAVIGSGLNQVYPNSHKKLQTQMMKEQLVVSEYPLDSKPLPYHFIERNRIIAGLCQKLLVTEAREKSGSLITANLALQDNRDVLAVPGDISSDRSKGCNELIKVGARPCLSYKDLLESSLI